jgi:hypothetical protein
MDMKLKRNIPSSEIISWRKSYLEDLTKLVPSKPSNNFPNGLAEGNKKTGRSGYYADKIFVWNLPSVITCPCTSDWCLSYCYNADSRKDVFPVDEWLENYWWSQNKPEQLINKIQTQLGEVNGSCAVRIHSSGDFYSPEYISMWQKIIKQNENVKFWAYTRSWANEKLKTHLDIMSSLPNLQLFASWDTSMKEAPKNWRKSYVCNTYPCEDIKLDTVDYFICPEQISEKENCASCGFCFSTDKRNIFFYLH